MWFYSFLWLTLTISIAACFSFIYETNLAIVDRYETTGLFCVVYILFFKIFLIPNLIAITFLVLVTRFPPLSTIQVPSLLFGVFLSLNVLITFIHVSSTFHKFPNTLLLRNAVLFFMVMSISLSILEKIGQKYLLGMIRKKCEKC